VLVKAVSFLQFNVFSPWLSLLARLLLTACFWLGGVNAEAQTIYKYQTPDGRWHFTDKAPKDKPQVEQTIEYQQRRPIREAPLAVLEAGKEGMSLVATNPWYGPVELLVEVRTDEYRYIRKTLAANISEVIMQFSSGQHPDIKTFYVPGAPLQETPPYQVYSPPIAAGAKFQISQGFNGKFSHSEQPNQYAVDIGMPLGTGIYAARGGVVMAIEKDFVIGSTGSAYFYDKANYVMLLHEDGTTAIYAHILQGSLKVSLGAQVARGDLLAKSGNSGFSTGPHLHFAVRMNSRSRLKSIPFSMTDAAGQAYKMERGVWLTGW